MSLPDDILRILGEIGAPANLATIIASVRRGQTEETMRKRCSHALVRLRAARKVERVGEIGNFHYALFGCMPANFIPPPKSNRLLARKPKPESRPGRRRGLKAPVASDAPFQSVDEWLANGGSIQRLPMGACAEPLRYAYGRQSVHA